MNIIKKVFYRLQFLSHSERKLKPATNNENALAEKLRNDMTIVSNNSNSTDFWYDTQLKLKHLVSSQDTRTFLKWDIIRHTMVHKAILEEYNTIKKSKHWPILKKVIDEDHIGLPDRYYFHPTSSGNLVHHLYSLNELLNKSNFNLNDIKSVFEFGGGYGSFARIFLKLKEDIRYTIFDLQCFSALQEYYLKSIFNDLTVFHNENENKNGVVLFSDTNKIDFQRKYDLFIALWSLSETPLSFRSDFIKIMRNSNYFIVALQGEFYGIDNEVYFKTIKDELKEFEIKFYPINHMNVNYKKGNYYFIGSKKTT